MLFGKRLPEVGRSLGKGMMEFKKGLNDIKTTPLSAAIPGVEVHALVLEQILAGDFLSRPDWAFGAELIYLVVFGIILIVAIRRVGALWSWCSACRRSPSPGPPPGTASRATAI
ncbi:MAG: CHASE2 domain-containing protein [Leptolyngbyaceae cyanobacterium SU_3_3]|nr:CHASE2 domain-containing protein [Leptolyngbyaceae cyanobacterium SU_3_3]